MILPREDIAWVEHDDGSRAPFDVVRLTASIHRAAEHAGQPDWWLAESVAAAVHHYACECATAETVTLVEIVNIVVDVLAMLNYTKISAAYAQQQHCVEVRLDELAATPGAAFELEFFSRLDAALRAVADAHLALVQVCGLRACVLQLRSARRWNAGCRKLAEEIIGHVRARIERTRPAQAVSLNVTVVE